MQHLRLACPATPAPVLFAILSFWILAQVSQPAGAQDYQLIWADEFDGTAVDLDKWQFQLGTGCPTLCGWGNNELQYYRAENATVSGGFLTIAAKEEAVGGRAYTSTRMRTRTRLDFLYGKVEMRAKMPLGQGLWPAFWMLPTNSPYGIWPTSGEIDIMEYLGHDPDTAYGTIHYGDPHHVFSGSDYTLPSGTFADSFHTFAIEWEPQEIRWYVDGIQYACQSNWASSGGPYPAPFDNPFHLLLNLAVGGNWPGPPDATTNFPAEMMVDWVRVWQKPLPASSCCALFDGMDHGNPLGNGWFTFGGPGGGTISGNTVDLPPDEGCGASLQADWGGPDGFIGGFGLQNPMNLEGMTHFEFWINPAAGQSYTLEINLQDDDNGDNTIPNGGPDDDEFQYDFVVSPTGPDAIAGGGWQKASIPLSSFYDDNSFLPGGNGVFDPVPTSENGNGQLIFVVVTIVSQGGGDQNFLTDRWQFVNPGVTSAPGATLGTRPALLGGGFPNPFGASTRLRFELPQAGPLSAEVFDLRGRRVRELTRGWQEAGPRDLTWDGRNAAGEWMPSGVYFVRFISGNTVETRKLVLQR